ncbi:MAG: 2Fe-2S iron-sulfur cluster binding domain-containing protein [Gammaproteobacteria bacterium]|nr:2Fe-2S iron-sulfur cluster binding domain-containing protein [Gammaproteobacteria bacterium]
MKKFHALKVTAKSREAKDAIRIALEVADELRGEYAFRAGQHLPIQIERDGKKLRRTYSICSPEGQWPLEIGVRVQAGGAFGEFAANDLEVGDTLEVMPPTGRFHLADESTGDRFHVGFAAGSGITPILSIIATVLQQEPASRFALFYGNRKQDTTMFIDDLFALKNRYPHRLQLHFVFSEDEQEFAIGSGRLDADKVAQLHKHFCAGVDVDEAWVCGPGAMIDTVTDALVGLGMREEDVHAERFGVPRGERPPVRSAVSADTTQVTLIMDGHKKGFDMPRDGSNIVDAAAAQGVELPYSCKGGVCATCRTHLRSGKVDMAVNYGLEPWEVEQGFVLACQSTPLSDDILLDYDKS